MVIRFQPVANIIDEIDTLINSSSVPFPTFKRINNTGRFGAVSMKESPEQVHVNVELPGITKQDVTVSVKDSVLTISAERKEPELQGQEQWIRNEISFGKYERTINLPYTVDGEKVSASHENGILQIILPKHENAKPKQISIR